MSITVDDGALITKDPEASQTYTFNWSENLAAGVQIGSASVRVAAIRPSTVDVALTSLDVGTGLGILAGARTVGVQLTGGTPGQTYEVTCQVVTTETPAQTKERSFRVLIEQQ